MELSEATLSWQQTPELGQDFSRITQVKGEGTVQLHPALTVILILAALGIPLTSPSQETFLLAPLPISLNQTPAETP